jgi:Cu-Zn family superoxide dismutase
MVNKMCINAIAVFKNKKVSGVIKFHQCDRSEETTVIFDLYGMKPNEIHACHIHEYGDERKGCKSLGSHWNPEGTTHGCMYFSIPNPREALADPSRGLCVQTPSHAGDLLNNIMIDRDGMFKYSYTDPRIKLRGNVTESIIGRSIVIHEGIDDLGLGGNEESLKTGNAGGRMACAIIGHSK